MTHRDQWELTFENLNYHLTLERTTIVEGWNDLKSVGYNAHHADDRALLNASTIEHGFGDPRSGLWSTGNELGHQLFSYICYISLRARSYGCPQ